VTPTTSKPPLWKPMGWRRNPGFVRRDFYYVVSVRRSPPGSGLGAGFDFVDRKLGAQLDDDTTIEKLVE
jgi:hypothetical protein